MPADFDLDPRIVGASEPLASLPLCEVRLQNDARFPWIVLIPRRRGARELEDLSREDRIALLDEIARASEAVRRIGEALGRPVEKLNLGALGNVAPQLHWHVVGRRADDPAWPGPVWGFGRPEPYAPETLAAAREAALAALR